jgi:hypothetical protein
MFGNFNNAAQSLACSEKYTHSIPPHLILRRSKARGSQQWHCERVSNEYQKRTIGLIPSRSSAIYIKNVLPKSYCEQNQPTFNRNCQTTKAQPFHSEAYNGPVNWAEVTKNLHKESSSLIWLQLIAPICFERDLEVLGKATGLFRITSILETWTIPQLLSRIQGTSTPPIYCRIMSWKLEILVHVAYPLLFYEAEFQFGNRFRRTLGRQCIHKTNHEGAKLECSEEGGIGLDKRDDYIHDVCVSWRFQ